MKKLPKKLYHFTSSVQMGYIREDGYIKLTASNLKMDDATFHIEPIYRNGKEIGKHAVDKYFNYHPVVWLTASENVTANQTGISTMKTQCRITIPTIGRNWKFLKWTDFLIKYNANPLYANTLKQANGADWRNWYVCEEPISLSDISLIEYLQSDGTYAPAEN